MSGKKEKFVPSEVEFDLAKKILLIYHSRPYTNTSRVSQLFREAERLGIVTKVDALLNAHWRGDIVLVGEGAVESVQDLPSGGIMCLPTKGGSNMGKTIRYHVTWETDGEDVTLPEEVDVPTHDEVGDPIDDVAGWLSDEYGWLVLDLDIVDDS